MCVITRALLRGRSKLPSQLVIGAVAQKSDVWKSQLAKECMLLWKVEKRKEMDSTLKELKPALGFRRLTSTTLLQISLSCFIPSNFVVAC